MNSLTNISELKKLEWIKANFPKLSVKNSASHEITIINPERRDQGMIIKLPHDDLKLKAIAFWADCKQTIIQSDNSFDVEETSRWHDETIQWKVSFDTWLDEWLKLFNSNEPGPIRPGYLNC